MDLHSLGWGTICELKNTLIDNHFNKNSISSCRIDRKMYILMYQQKIRRIQLLETKDSFEKKIDCAPHSRVKFSCDNQHESNNKTKKIDSIQVIPKGDHVKKILLN